MKEEKEIRKRVVEEETTVYIAKDGKRCTSKEECEVHEMILDGKAKVCPDCHGKKFRYVITHDFKWVWPYETIERKEWKECPTCRGKGYLVRKEKWE